MPSGDISTSPSHGGRNIVDAFRNSLGNLLDSLAKTVRGSDESRELQGIPLHNPNLQSGEHQYQNQNSHITRTTSLATTIPGVPVSIQRPPPPPPPPPLPQPSSPTNSMSELSATPPADTPLMPNRRYELHDPSTSLTRQDTINSNYTAADSLPSYRSRPFASHREVASISQVIEESRRTSTPSIMEVPREEYLPGPSQVGQRQSLGRWPTNSSMRTYTTLPGYKSPAAGSEIG
ncbi:hypothetical protein VKT23_006205 [Stygiomarasmius scandens]|uniref:Uncharacterized protein n=1 Tax=Marasmiellus scandens TaxID=2682957 RepID=A0ABR1JPH5_9AGAR